MRIVVLLLAGFMVLSQASAQKAPPKSPTKKAVPTKTKSAPVAKGFNIPITLTPLKNTWIYLGCHYGKYKSLVDSAYLNANSQGVFKGKEKLPPGIYFAISEKKVFLFEFLIDQKQQFSIKADTSAYDKVQITGSEENTIFQDYTKFLAVKTPRLSGLQRQLEAARTAADSANIKQQLADANKELQQYRENITKTKSNSMLAMFFNTMKRPDTPPMPTLPNGKVDSTYPFRYVKDHFWDDVDFSKDGLVRTPFFEPKLEEFYKYYVDPNPDSIISEVNLMLLMARNGKEIFKYLLGKFTDKYINPEYMGQDKVFLFLFNNYYSKGDTAWLNEKQKKYIFDRGYSLIANQLGEQAWDMQLLDTANKATSLHGTLSPYTMVIFWDPNCGHCKEVVPRVDSIYKAKWKAQGVAVFAVNVAEELQKEWRKFIVEKDLRGWVHAYQPKAQRDEENKTGKPNFRQLYDVFQTPTLYLLDKDKRIIAKKLSVEQFDDVLQAKIKNTSTKQ